MKLPEHLYVKIEDATEVKNAWFNAQMSKEDLIDVGERAEVGVYKLVQKIKLKGEVVEE